MSLKICIRALKCDTRGERNFISLTNDFVIVVQDEIHLGSQQYSFNFLVNPILLLRLASAKIVYMKLALLANLECHEITSFA